MIKGLRTLTALLVCLIAFTVFSCERTGVQSPAKARKMPGGAPFVDAVTGMEFVRVKGGCYKMGDTYGDGDGDEKPVHEVCVSDFYIGKYEVTQGQWTKVMGSNPSRFASGDEYPVENVSWNDAQLFIGKLNREAGAAYRLPTEAEWEYAAREGGGKTRYSGTSDENRLSWFANFCDSRCEYGWKITTQDDNAENTSQVGKFRPNKLGIYDMSGNVWEWIQDRYDENYYLKSPRDNPAGGEKGKRRVIRGGSWSDVPDHLRAAERDSLEPERRSNNTGFRLVMPVAR